MSLLGHWLPGSKLILVYARMPHRVHENVMCKILMKIKETPGTRSRDRFVGDKASVQFTLVKMIDTGFNHLQSLAWMCFVPLLYRQVDDEWAFRHDCSSDARVVAGAA